MREIDNKETRLEEEFERKKKLLGVNDKELKRAAAEVSKRNTNLIVKLLSSQGAKYVFYGAMLAGIGVCLSETALATSSKFDISAGIEGGTKPLITAIKEHWGKGVLLSGGASAFIGEGDARQRAIRAIIGCLASGGVVMALIAMLTD